MAEDKSGTNFPTSPDMMVRFTEVLDQVVDKVNKKETPEPSVFNLKAGRPLEDFLGEYGRFAHDRFGGDTDIWAIRLPMYLAEPLKGLVETMNAARSNYIAITQFLLDSYGRQVDPLTATDYVFKFQECRYKPDEGIQGLVVRLRSLATRAYQGQSQDIIDDLVKRQCLSVLPDKMKTPLQFQHLTNPRMPLQEVIRIATALEKQAGEEEPIEVLEAAAQRQTSGAGVRPKTFTTRYCQVCRNKGHTKEECRRRLKSCFMCGQQGHFIAQCPSKSHDVTLHEKITPPKETISQEKCAFCSTIGHNMSGCPKFVAFMEQMMRKFSHSSLN